MGRMGMSGGQRPRWYYGGLEPASGVTLEPTQLPLELTCNAQMLLWYGYWLVISTLAFLSLAAIALLTKRFLSAQRQRPSQLQGDPEEAALLDALHLLDTVMEKMWHHLRSLEKRRRRRKGARLAS